MLINACGNNPVIIGNTTPNTESYDAAYYVIIDFTRMPGFSNYADEIASKLNGNHRRSKPIYFWYVKDGELRCYTLVEHSFHLGCKWLSEQYNENSF